jgi:hypothetical protein
MRDPHVRFCERHGGAILRAYSTLGFGNETRLPETSVCAFSMLRRASKAGQMPPPKIVRKALASWRSLISTFVDACGTARCSGLSI